MTITIFSNSIESEKPIDKKYTFTKGNNIQPHIKIDNVPDETKQLILLMYDPDAVKVCGKVFVHWFVQLDPSVTELQENEQFTTSDKNDKITVLANDIGKKAYCGPAPPKGTGVHNYHLAVYAINEVVCLDEVTGYESIQKNIIDKVISSNEIVGTYENI